MKFSSQLPVGPQLHINPLIQAESDEIQWLFHCAFFLCRHNYLKNRPYVINNSLRTCHKRREWCAFTLMWFITQLGATALRNLDNRAWNAQLDTVRKCLCALFYSNWKVMFIYRVVFLAKRVQVHVLRGRGSGDGELKTSFPLTPAYRICHCQRARVTGA